MRILPHPKYGYLGWWMLPRHQLWDMDVESISQRTAALLLPIIQVEVVPQRTAAVLLPTIHQHELPETIIRSDQWASYNQLAGLSFFWKKMENILGVSEKTLRHRAVESGINKYGDTQQCTVHFE